MAVCQLFYQRNIFDLIWCHLTVTGWCCVDMNTDEASSVNSRYSSTSTLCPSVVDMSVGPGAGEQPAAPSDEASPPPLPPRQRRRGSSHGHCSSVDSLSPPPHLPHPPPLPLSTAPQPLPTDDCVPPIPPRSIDLQRPPLPPRRSTAHEHGVPPSPPIYPPRRPIFPPAPSATMEDDFVPELPPKTYRQSHVRDSSS